MDSFSGKRLFEQKNKIDDSLKGGGGRKAFALPKIPCGGGFVKGFA